MTGDVPDFRSVTVEALAASVRQGERTALDVTDAALARIERDDPSLNAFVAVDADRAREEAAAIDARIAADGEYPSTDAVLRETSEATATIALNAELLAKIQAASVSGEPVTLHIACPKSAVMVESANGTVSALMPVYMSN